MVKKEPILCLECGEPVRGRADKRFCTDQCRSQYNNKLNSDRVNLVRNINLVLKKNRRIMEGLLQSGSEPFKPRVVKRDVLVKAGFNFNFTTHRLTTQKGHTYSYCYEFGYREMDRDDVMVVRDEKAIPEKEK